METRFIDIDYEERSDLSAYRGVAVRSKDGDLARYNSGDVAKDFADMRAWCLENPIEGKYMFTSSVDHFCMDVPGYKWIVDEDGREMIARMSEDEAAEQRAEMAEEADDKVE